MTNMSVPALAATVSVADSVPNVLTAPAQYLNPLSVTQVASGSQALRTERLKVTLVNASGESYPSVEFTIQVLANNVVLVQSPTVHGAGQFPNKPYAWNLYATTGGTNTETLQNTTPITLGQNWQEPATGLINGTSQPTAVAPLPGYTTNANPLDTPPVTGNLAPPQSPAGTSVTNTGRSRTATQTYLSQFVIS